MHAGTQKGEGWIRKNLAGVAWKPVFLGPDIPAEDIASATRQLRASAVALSAIFPAGGALPRELSRIASLLPEDTPLFVGGAAAMEQRDLIEGGGGFLVTDYPTFRTQLRRIAMGASPRMNGA